MASKANTHTLVGSKAVAELLGVDVRRVQQLTKEGIIEAQRVKGANKYDLYKAAQQYIQYLRESNGGREKPQGGEVKLKKAAAEADLKRHKADIARLQLAELEGQMHRSEDVEAVLTDLVNTMRSMFTSLPGRLAVDVQAAKTPAEAAALIRQEVNAIMVQLTQYRYDPTEFARRVRAREGWQEIAGAEDGE